MMDVAAHPAFLPLTYDGWSCRRLELTGDEEIRARFEASQSDDFVEVQVVARDVVGTLRQLDHCAVRYRAKVGLITPAARTRMGEVVMGTAAAVDARLAASPGSNFAQAFGRRSRSGKVLLSVETIRELLAPDIVEGQEILAGWRLEAIAPFARPRAGDTSLQVQLTFLHAPTGQRLQLFTARRDDHPSLATTTHLSLTHPSFDKRLAPGSDVLLALVVFLLQVRDHDQLDLVVPQAPPELLKARGAIERPVTARDEWDVELDRLKGEIAKKELACLRPWTTAERLGSHQVLPCCQRFLQKEVLEQCDPNVESLVEAWNSPGLQSVRRAISEGRPHDTCREDCPTFHGDNSATLEVLFEKPKTQPMFENMVKIMQEIVDGVEQVDTVPLQVQVSVEEKCNIKCVMCSVSFSDGVGGGIVLEEPGAKELVSLFPKLRTLNLIGGEPTMAPLTRELLAEFDLERYPDGTAQMITNGILLTPKYTEALKKSRLVLMVSLNAATPETYEKITLRKGGFERVLANIRSLLAPDAGFIERPIVVLSFVVMKDSYLEVPAFLKIASELNCPIRLQAVYGELGGQSIFTDEALLRTVSDFFETQVLPGIGDFPEQYRENTSQVASMMKSRLERRDFSPY